MNNPISKLIPEQTKEKATDAKDRVSHSNTKEAGKIFLTAIIRMLDVNRWHEYSGLASAKFFITDERGNQCNRSAQKGDYLKIDIPGPDPRSGNAYDWVHIDALESNIGSFAPSEFCDMMVRSAENPSAGNIKIAHFF
jgi:hypothetical protein